MMDARPPRRLVVLAFFRAALSAIALVVLYFILPLNEDVHGTVALALGGGLIGLGFILAFQVRGILSATYPLLRAIEALATAIPILLLLFSSIYILLLHADATSFSHPFDRIGGLYFSVTTFTTTGFGDIAAKSDLARVIVTIQMLVDLVIIGLVARVIVSAVQIGRERQAAQRESGES
jgi:hypothetical protein